MNKHATIPGILVFYHLPGLRGVLEHAISEIAPYILHFGAAGKRQEKAAPRAGGGQLTPQLILQPVNPVSGSKQRKKKAQKIEPPMSFTHKK